MRDDHDADDPRRVRHAVAPFGFTFIYLFFCSLPLSSPDGFYCKEFRQDMVP